MQQRESDFVRLKVDADLVGRIREEHGPGIYAPTDIAQSAGPIDLSGRGGIEVVGYEMTPGFKDIYHIHDRLVVSGVREGKLPRYMEAEDAEKWWFSISELELKVHRDVCPWVLEQALREWNIHPVPAGYAVQDFTDEVYPEKSSLHRRILALVGWLESGQHCQVGEG